VPNRAVSYFPRYAADPKYGLHATREIDLSCYAGAMVYVSTAPDLARFGLAVNNGALLTPDTVRRLHAAQSLTAGPEAGQDTGYGLGWDRETITLAGRETTWVGHSGTMLGGMVGSVMILPERGVVVAILSNIAYADTEALAAQVAEGFLPGR
jgi:CubicO group peptidase (beta-lactamase class C family)